MADELVDTGVALGELVFLRRLRIDLSRLATRFPYILITPQYHVERLLRRRADANGVQIRHGCDVLDVCQDADGVHVDTSAGPWRSTYLVGTDGVRSTVRRAAGLDFPGRTVARSVMLADVRLARPPANVLTANAAGRAFAVLAPFGDGWYRAVAWRRDMQLPDDVPTDLDEIRATVREALGDDFGMHDARWTSRFHSDERQVAQYRVGRLFLAGDAAHVHSPAGGQGLNTGLQDAANLGWKLAADLTGRACAGLLDTYHDERHRVGRQVLRMSGAMLRLALLPPAWQPIASAAAAVASAVPAVTKRAAGRLSGLAISYPRPPGGHRLAGRRAPDVSLRDGGRLYEELRHGRFVLVGDHLADRFPGDHGRVRAATPSAPTDLTILVRPDGYVAWAADRPAAPTIRRAIDRWCPSGAPAPR